MNATVDVATARRQQAEGRLLVIKNALKVADEELERAFVERDWEVFGLASFVEYCDEKLPDLRHVKLRREVRQQRARRLRDAGASYPEIVAATGASLGSIHRDLNPQQPFQMESSPPLSPEVIEEMTAWQVVVRHVSRAGAQGLTCLGYEKATGRRHGAASAAFHNAERKGYIVRDGRLREGYGVYVSAY